MNFTCHPIRCRFHINGCASFLFSFRLIPPPLQILVDATFSSNLAYSLLRAISHQVIEEEEGEECRVYRLGGATGWWWRGCTLTHCE